jgi:hypothetical protein
MKPETALSEKPMTGGEANRIIVDHENEDTELFHNIYNTGIEGVGEIRYFTYVQPWKAEVLYEVAPFVQAFKFRDMSVVPQILPEKWRYKAMDFKDPRFTAAQIDPGSMFTTSHGLLHLLHFSKSKYIDQLDTIMVEKMFVPAQFRIWTTLKDRVRQVENQMGALLQRLDESERHLDNHRSMIGKIKDRFYEMIGHHEAVQTSHSTMVQILRDILSHDTA